MESLTYENLAIKVSAYGAELKSLKKTEASTEYLWQADPAWWARSSPVLFPIVGKAANDRILIDKESYPMNQHGFARDMEFRLVEHSDNLLIYRLESSEETLKHYPFHFKLEISYQIRAGELFVQYQVFNEGTVDLPFSIGAHPAFNLSTGRMSDYSLVFEKEENAAAYSLRNGLFTGETYPVFQDTNILALNTTLFNKDALVFKDLKSTAVRLTDKDGPLLEMRFEGFPYFGIWSKPGCEEFICLEPWYGLADKEGFSGSISEKEGILLLEPGYSRRFAWTLILF